MLLAQQLRGWVGVGHTSFQVERSRTQSAPATLSAISAYYRMMWMDSNTYTTRNRATRCERSRGDAHPQYHVCAQRTYILGITSICIDVAGMVVKGNGGT